MQGIRVWNNVRNNFLNGFDVLNETGNLAAGDGGRVRVTRIVGHLAFAAGHGFDDFFKQKVEHSQDRVDLILGEITGREQLKSDNLIRLYDDLLRVDQFRAQIPFPQKYQKDNAWSGLNDQELRLREQIRRELKESAKDLSFPNKDMRESLLEFKLRNAKSHMMKGVGLDAIIEPEGS